MVKNIFDRVDYLQKGLDAAWLRNEVITNNIANADTPGFKRSYVEFESVLQEQQGISIKTTRENHISTPNTEDISPKVIRDDNTTVRMDGNNVDIEYESAELAKNTIWYNYMVQKISKEFGRLNKVINEGK
jgi:flagellar basal-body rod protein FlgB